MLAAAAPRLRLPRARQAAVRGRARRGSARAAWSARPTSAAQALVEVGPRGARPPRRGGARLRLVRAAGSGGQPRELRLAGRGGARGRAWTISRPRRGGRSRERAPAVGHASSPTPAPRRPVRRSRRVIRLAREAGVEVRIPAAEAEKHGLEPQDGVVLDADPARPHRPRDRARRRRHDPVGAADLRRALGPGVRRQLRRDRLPGHGGAGRARGGAPARARRRLRRDEPPGAGGPDRAGRAARHQRPVVPPPPERPGGGAGLQRGRADLGEVRCDGLVVATPAGSTGYNLANGGPVLAWGVEGFVVSFIAPHTLTARALVVAPDDVLEVTNRSADRGGGPHHRRADRMRGGAGGERQHPPSARLARCSRSPWERPSTHACATSSAVCRF